MGATAAGDGGRIFIRSAFVQNRGLGSDWEAKDDNTLLAAGACALPGDGKVCWSRACIMASGGSFTRQREPFFLFCGALRPVDDAPSPFPPPRTALGGTA